MEILLFMLEESNTKVKYKVSFIQGRPQAHQMHRKFAQSVGAVFSFVDLKMRWQDRNKSVFYRIVSWFVCAITFPNLKKYNIFFVDNLHFMPVLMKKLRLNSKRQKIVAHLGSHTLYFIYSHRFSKWTEKLHVWALKNYDALICEGLMAEYMVNQILGSEAPPTYSIVNGIPDEHFPKSGKVAELSSNTILFVGHGPGKERLWYKGLDLMIEAFDIAKQSNNNLQFVIVGDWTNDVQAELLGKLSKSASTSVKFVGSANDMERYFTESSLYLHCARGEAYGITILIAMTYGLPTIVSNWTGAKEVVEQVDSTFVVELEANIIAQKMIEYFNMTLNEKQKLGSKFKEVGKEYTESRAINDFKNKFEQMVVGFKL